MLVGINIARRKRTHLGGPLRRLNEHLAFEGNCLSEVLGTPCQRVPLRQTRCSWFTTARYPELWATPWFEANARVGSEPKSPMKNAQRYARREEPLGHLENERCSESNATVLADGHGTAGYGIRSQVGETNPRHGETTTAFVAQ